MDTIETILTIIFWILAIGGNILIIILFLASYREDIFYKMDDAVAKFFDRKHDM